ncbi:hypothetical protein Dsin_006131 [Dipteronia sinensis]|uniref:Uncharacterized protein n=1 Tax=Dipteronia sinensis TaxID=43782 RepID=A0AAE0EFK3_9ROSI|nr:hypothetical protein Dsin_006131 [Dipteronia sinensis]
MFLIGLSELMQRNSRWWTELLKGVKGSIPSSISVLKNLGQWWISDLSGSNHAFPELANMTSLTQIILRNCSIFGEVPQYICEKKVCAFCKYVTHSIIDLKSM